MTFKEFNQQIGLKFNEIQYNYKLFRSSVTGDELWDTYISSFKKEHDPVFRDPESSSHNCNNDKNFIRRYGNIVGIDENFNIVSMFDLGLDKNNEYYNSTKNMVKLLKSKPIANVFFETFNELNTLPYDKIKKSDGLFKLGHSTTFKQYTKDEADKFGVVNTKDIYEFHHFHIFLDKNFVDFSNKSIESIMGDYRDPKNVFKRGLDEIPLDTLELVYDLINQNSLLNGETYKNKVFEFIKLKKEYDTIDSKLKDNWTWAKSYKNIFAKFRGEVIGTLCVDLAEGVELNKACLSWNKKVDPINFMRAKAPITQKQIDEAKKFVEENGYEDSFNRRFATMDDIKVPQILHSNVGDGKLKSFSKLDNIKPTSTRHKRSEFDKIEEVSIDKFMKDILPNCTSVEAFLENRMDGNMVSLTTANTPDSKPIFKWSNNLSWTYNGNLAGKSMIKDNVKAVGGKITGILRCSLQWNDEDTIGVVDYDLHCKTPYNEIYYSNKNCTNTKGWLDVDMIRPTNIGIENITWQEKLKDGEYHFFVKNFCGGSNKGFKVEIEFDGNTYNYYYQNTTSYKQNVDVATITVKNGLISIKHHLSESSSSKEIYGLETNKFHKVNLVCLSPNYWDDNNVGNKHYFFTLDNCKSPDKIRSFHNENLKSDLLVHRKVMEVLGANSMIESTDKQLSGLGFNSTVKDELVVKLSGSFKRTIKIKF